MTFPDYYSRLEFYTKALRIRMIEQAVAKRYPEGEMRCPVHLSIGQEANAVAICNSLTDNDFMVSTHRSHAHYLAKGGNLGRFLGELYGKHSGCSRGNGGSMHLVSTMCGYLGSTSIVGGTIPIGVGAALAARLKGEKRVTAICFGDAATEEGVFHESANFASLHNLPIVFFMENNNYSCFTSREKRQPLRDYGFKSLAKAHGLEYINLSWDRFYAGVNMLDLAITILRGQENPTPLFVECDAYRFVEHCGPNSDDNLNYRPPEEVLKFTALDPIKVLEAEMRNASFLTVEMHEKIVEKIKVEIDNAFDEVHKSPAPSREDLGKYLYA